MNTNLAVETPKQVEKINPNEGREIYEVAFKKYHRVQFGHIRANNLKEAGEKMKSYCELHQMTFVSVVPFFLDLTLRPPKAQRELQPLPEVVEEITPPPQFRPKVELPAE